MSYSRNRIDPEQMSLGRRIRPYAIAGIAVVAIVGIALSVYQRIGEFGDYLDRKAVRDAAYGHTKVEVLTGRQAETRAVRSGGDNEETADDNRQLFTVADVPEDSETYGAIVIGSKEFEENAPKVAGALSLLGDQVYDTVDDGTGAGSTGSMKVAFADVWSRRSGYHSHGSDGGASPSNGSPSNKGTPGGGGDGSGGAPAGGSGPDQTASLPSGPSGGGGHQETQPQTSEDPTDTASTGNDSDDPGNSSNPTNSNDPSTGNTGNTPSNNTPPSTTQSSSSPDDGSTKGDDGTPLSTLGDDGTPVNNDGNDSSPPNPVTVVDTGTLGGTDPVDGDLVIGDDATHTPGHSPGQLDVSGDYILNGVLEIELAGTDPGTGYDQIIAGGDAILDGTIKVLLLDDFVPNLDDVFDIIVADSIQLLGGFSIELPDLPDNKYFYWKLVTLSDGRTAFRLIDPIRAAIPGPAAGLVFLSGLGVLVAIRRRRTRIEPKT